MITDRSSAYDSVFDTEIESEERVRERLYVFGEGDSDVEIVP